MTHRSSTRTKTCYGIDLSDGFLVVTRSSRTRKGIEHEVLVQGQSTDPAADFAPVADAMREELARGGAVAAGALPVAASFTRWLTTPFPSVTKARKVFPSLLDIQLPFPLETCAYQFLEPSRTPERQVATLAVAAREGDLARRLDCFRPLVIDPEHLDHEGLALWTQSIDEVPVEANTCRVVTHLGYDYSTMALGLGTRFYSAHSTRVGVRDLLADDAAVRGNAQRQLTRRAQQILRAHLSDTRPGELQWMWTGPGAENGDEVQSLEQLLQDQEATFHSHRQPTSFLARALATRVLQQGPLRFNFRTGARAHAKVVRQEQRQQLASTVSLVLFGVLLCAINLGWQGLLEFRKDALQSQLTLLAKDLGQVQRAPKGREVAVVQQALEERKGLYGPFLEAFQPSLALLLNQVLDAAARHQISLDALSLRPDSISMNGTSEDWDRCRGLEDRIQNLQFKTTMELPDAGADELVHFVLQGSRER